MVETEEQQQRNQQQLQLDGNNEELAIDGVLTTQPELGPSVPDGGYGWIVFLATLFFQALIPSLITSFGIFLAFLKLGTITKEDVNPFLWDDKLIYTPLLFIASWTFFDPTARALISTSTWPRLVATSGTCLTCAGLLFLWMGMAGYGEISFYPLAGIISGIGRDDIIHQLEEEALAAQQKFDEIADKWSSILKYNDPLHIHDEINSQKEKCDLLIKQKDGIIEMLRDEIKNSERKFSKDQHKQEEDIDRLAQRIEKQMIFMRNSYKNELEQIEEQMLTERKKQINKADKRWEDLYKKREELEIENSQAKYQQLQDFEKKIDVLHNNFYEEFRGMKINLESEVSRLHQEFQNVKALALLNKEKLDYNYQILKKRNDENLQLKTQQKRRLNKLHDVTNALRLKVNNYNSSTKKKLVMVKQNLENVKQQINELERKADHFAKVNNSKFTKMWKMNENTCRKMLNRILSIDKVLYEQQLGLVWEPPLRTINALSFRRSVKKSEINLSGIDDEESPETEADMSQQSEYRRLIKQILVNTSDKSGFLSEKRLRMILSVHTAEHRDLVKLDNIFLSLGINRKEDINLLSKYFIPYSYCTLCKLPTSNKIKDEDSLSTVKYGVSSRLSAVVGATYYDDVVDVHELQDALLAIQQPEHEIYQIVMDLVSNASFLSEAKSKGEREDICGGGLLEADVSEIKEKVGRKRLTSAKESTTCIYSHPVYIPSIYTMIALRDFVSDYYSSLEKYPTMNERMERKRITVARQISVDDIQAFWHQFQLVFDKDKVKFWGNLLVSLEQYHEVLKDRSALYDEVVALRKQNSDIKRLLANYINSEEAMGQLCGNKAKAGFGTNFSKKK